MFSRVIYSMLISMCNVKPWISLTFATPIHFIVGNTHNWPLVKRLHAFLQKGNCTYLAGKQCDANILHCISQIASDLPEVFLSNTSILEPRIADFLKIVYLQFQVDLFQPAFGTEFCQVIGQQPQTILSAIVAVAVPLAPYAAKYVKRF